MLAPHGADVMSLFFEMFGDVQVGSSNLRAAELSRINVIMGENATGRTTLLKSIYDHANNNDGLHRFGEPYNLGLSQFGRGYADTSDDLDLKTLSRLWMVDTDAGESHPDHTTTELLGFFLKAAYPNIERAEYDSTEEVVFFYLKDTAKRIHIKNMGASLLHVMRIIYAVGATENGVVVIDDIDSGLTMSTLLTLWIAIAKLAEDNGNQVFAVVNSSDAMRAAATISHVINRCDLLAITVDEDSRAADGLFTLRTANKHEFKALLVSKSKAEVSHP